MQRGSMHSFRPGLRNARLTLTFPFLSTCRRKAGELSLRPIPDELFPWFSFLSCCDFESSIAPAHAGATVELKFCARASSENAGQSSENAGQSSLAPKRAVFDIVFQKTRAVECAGATNATHDRTDAHPCDVRHANAELAAAAAEKRIRKIFSSLFLDMWLHQNGVHCNDIER